MEEIPDPVFSGGVMGECVGIRSTDGRGYRRAGPAGHGSGSFADPGQRL
ncbi:MAG: hypothetical protein IJX90_03135 [Blautia sp.]|nr:hypothetical protein [Blautia sp.]